MDTFEGEGLTKGFSIDVTMYLGISVGSQPRLQKFSPILIKLSVFVELLMLSILFKIFF
jgi:hypothetical protein